MTPGIVIDLFREALIIIILFVGVLIIPSLLVGLIVSIFQAVTQINEQTLSFLPRLMVTLGMLIVAGPWILRTLIEYTQSLVRSIPLLLG